VPVNATLDAQNPATTKPIRALAEDLDAAYHAVAARLE